MPLAPILPTPFSDLQWTFFLQPHNFLPGHFCTELYLKYIDCQEAYGLERGKYKCAEYYFDLQECTHTAFQRARAKAIREERIKKYKEGKLQEKFDQKPPLDSYYNL